MQPQITEKQKWYKIDGGQGIEFFLADHFGLPIEARKEYPGKVESLETIYGHGCRLSMPGYLDCTEWTVFDTAKECAEHLLSMWFDYPNDEMTPDQEEQRIELEAIAE